MLTGSRRLRGRQGAATELDDIDRRILDVLQRDGRISFEDLARQVGLTASPCLRRVRRMERDGVITGYAAVVDPQARGGGLRVFVGVRLLRQQVGDCHAFETAVSALAEVTECHHVTGDYSYLLRVEVADIAAYRAFHSEKLAALPAVSAATSYVVMATLRHGG